MSFETVYLSSSVGQPRSPDDDNKIIDKTVEFPRPARLASTDVGAYNKITLTLVLRRKKQLK